MHRFKLPETPVAHSFSVADRNLRLAAVRVMHHQPRHQRAILVLAVGSVQQVKSIEAAPHLDAVHGGRKTPPKSVRPPIGQLDHSLNLEGHPAQFAGAGGQFTQTVFPAPRQPAFHQHRVEIRPQIDCRALGCGLGHSR